MIPEASVPDRDAAISRLITSARTFVQDEGVIDLLPSPELLAELRPHFQAARHYAASSRSPSTRTAYEQQWRGFVAWCEEHGLPALPAPPWVVVLYLSARANAGRRRSTIQLGLTAISQAHQLAGHDSPWASPLVMEVWKGIKRELRGVPPTQKVPLSTDLVRLTVEPMGNDMRGLRDRALITVGFAGGFRRSELARIERHEVTFVDGGMEILLPWSKTDQEGETLLKVFPYGEESTCPVRNMRVWLERSGIEVGPVFRRVHRSGRIGTGALTGHSVARIIKGAARKVGLEHAVISGHSLRAGFVTQAKQAGVDDRSIMLQTGHKSRDMMDRYDRRIRAWDSPAAGKIGL